mgnify:CR=1 FL=1
MSRTRDARHVLLAVLLSVLLACGSLVGGGVQVASGETAGGGEKDVVVVSLGDSYSSGEGVEPFYGQNDDKKVNDQDWLAHRSTKSWPGKLRVNGGTVLLSENKADPADPGSDQGSAAWYFLASSGAVTANLALDSSGDQGKEVTLDRNGNHVDGAVALPLLTEKVDRTVTSQGELLSSICGAHGGSVDYVTMTIGGNDVGFTDVVRSCVDTQLFDFRGVENALGEAEQTYHDEARDNIRQAYVNVSQTAGAQSHVLVAGYPTLLDPSDGFAIFHRNEALMINNKVEWFNAELEKIVDEVNAENDGTRGQLVFVSVASEFRGHEAYSDSPYLNGVIIPAQGEDLTRFPPLSAYSIHPNELGTDAYARAVQRAIDQIEGGQAQAPAPTDQTAPSQSQTTPATTTPVEKDVALVLDVSGSMDGRPLEETKNAASQFVDVALENGAACALVTYDNEAQTLSGFSSDGATLRSEALGLDSGGGTNIEDGLAQAAALLAARPQSAQYIVLMSDGEPNDGKTGDELIAYAESIRDPNGDGVDEVRIYALGFNESASGQDLLRGIASDGCFFSVQAAGDLTNFFRDIVDAINGVRFMYVRVACPVDVTVSYNGETLSSAGEEPLTRTSFGSLTFEEEVLPEGQEGAEDGSDLVKVLRLREGASYAIDISGYDTGTMDYSIGFIDDEGRYSDFRTFSGVGVTSLTRASTTAEVSETTSLRIDDNGDGTYDRTLRAAANEEGRLVDNTAVVVSVLAAYAVVFVLVTALLVRSVVRR